MSERVSLRSPLSLLRACKSITPHFHAVDRRRIRGVILLQVLSFRVVRVFRGYVSPVSLTTEHTEYTEGIFQDRFSCGSCVPWLELVKV